MSGSRKSRYPPYYYTAEAQAFDRLRGKPVIAGVAITIRYTSASKFLLLLNDDASVNPSVSP